VIPQRGSFKGIRSDARSRDYLLISFVGDPSEGELQRHQIRRPVQGLPPHFIRR
jgi:hypothetical protein